MRGVRLPAITSGLLFLLVSCAPVGRGLGGDPCLLQQYQERSFSIIGRIQGAMSTLTSRVDALQPSQYAISASQDISETLTALAEFVLTLGTQRTLLDRGAQPAEGQAFHMALHGVIERFDTGAEMLTQAYVDIPNGDTRAATAIVRAARERLRQGRLLLGHAGEDLATLKTYSPNC
jgi:hypothetical protein